MNKNIHRLLSKIEIKQDGSNCWIWRGSTNNQHYPSFNVQNNHKIIAHGGHRASYHLFKGEIPQGFEIDHLCFIRECVNPDHLEAVTREENILRLKIRNKKQRKGKRVSKSYDSLGRQYY